MFCTWLKCGKSIKIGDVTVILLKSNNNRVRLAIDADKSVEIEHERKDARKLKQDA